MTNYPSLVMLALKAALKAKDEILTVYDQKFDFEVKNDGTPITIADKNSNNAITSILNRTNILVISEETQSMAYYKRKNHEFLWLVDPLDGTKEFIKKNGEFTVNIGLIQNSVPVIGVTAVPVREIIYLGWLSKGAFKITICKNFKRHLKNNNIENILKHSDKLTSDNIFSRVNLAVSRSHPDDRTASIIQSLANENIPVKIIKKGSALKFCLLAEGSANIYMRGNYSYEWDTASGHALVNAAGGKVLSVIDGKPLKYNKPQLKNREFIAVASDKLLDIIKWKTFASKPDR